MWHYQDSSTLCHYGVLGMKWGQRRSRQLSKKMDKWKKTAKQQGNVVNTSATKKLARTAKKVNAIYNKEQRYGKAAKRVAKTRTPKLVVQSALFGTFGALKYNQNRAEGKTRVDSFLSSLGYKKLNDFTLGTYSTVDSRKKS